jgi:NhaP-type Na+/H+ or K+/H+ antiporter
VSEHPAVSGAASGAILFLCIVLLGQEFGYIDLSSLVTGILYLVVPAVIGGVIFGILGGVLARRARRKLLAADIKADVDAAKAAKK